MRSIYRSIATRHNLWMLGLTLAVLAGWHFGYVSEQNAGLIGFLGITMNNAGARVIDPILSTVAQGYQNAEFIGMNLFPYVPVGQRGGKIITFGKEDFALYATGRAPNIDGLGLEALGVHEDLIKHETLTIELVADSGDEQTLTISKR